MDSGTHDFGGNTHNFTDHRLSQVSQDQAGRPQTQNATGGKKGQVRYLLLSTTPLTAAVGGEFTINPKSTMPTM